MARMGHDNPRAALIYQHATREADQAINKAVKAARRRPTKRGPKDGADAQGEAAERGQWTLMARGP